MDSPYNHRKKKNSSKKDEFVSRESREIGKIAAIFTIFEVV
jgi:hypothetical protein